VYGSRPVRRHVLSLTLAAALAGAAAASAVAADSPPEEPPPTIAEGVTVAGVAVGGLTQTEAVAKVKAWFARPVRFRFHDRRWQVVPARVGARVDAAAAVSRALVAKPGATVPLPVTFARSVLRSYVARLAERYHRKPKDSRLRLRHLRPFISKAVWGRRVRRAPMRTAIRTTLVAHERGPIRLRVRGIEPKLKRNSFGAIVVIRRGSHRLYLYRNMHFKRRFGVAVGQPRYPTPLGRFTIVTKQRNPWWYPPNSDWAAGAQPIPPGPGNPLGTRWMGLSAPGVGIHGTPDAASIGYSASHGCIRMRIPDAERLYRRVEVGTTVFIVRA
jgi:lipoprotein-anchoring transpeptidase ErfK/SrfK